ncbi:hypothetical protein Vadar_000136 [Vaccinium darrowii]|uniref:Uncharacterized protein n=1 Tax=Vaccinium darrowii TaxID=229202 RepID=A0ACB7XVG6_9ERIC|nr:hypothetical protein Vadar_000136 [Vaccinium darrowii]
MDVGGRTALHRVAGLGNIEAAKLLVGRNKALPNMENHFKETPLFYAAEHGDRKMVEWLMELTLIVPIHSDIALKVPKRNSMLAFYVPKKEEDLKFQALTTLAGTPPSFKSGNSFNFLQELI